MMPIYIVLGVIALVVIAIIAIYNGLVAKRQTDGEIADALYISRRTASSHVARILGKLDVANRREAGVVAARLGLI